MANGLSQRPPAAGCHNGVTSEWGNIEAGVPQRSVLCPLLFLIFINGITFVVNHCKILLFADDTCLFIEVDNHTDAANKINEDLVKIHDWSNEWLVDFSPKKTKDLIISNRTSIDYPELKLDNIPIPRVTEHKHLGVTLANDLTWKKHAYNIGKKAYNCLGILRPLQHKIDRLTTESLY
jgi:hypothetical protein